MFCGGISKIYYGSKLGLKIFKGKAIWNKKDDVIDITLDLKAKIIKIAINNIDYGVAFKDIIDDEYLFGIGFYNGPNYHREFEFL